MDSRSARVLAASAQYDITADGLGLHVLLENIGLDPSREGLQHQLALHVRRHDIRAHSGHIELALARDTHLQSRADALMRNDDLDGDVAVITLGGDAVDSRLDVR